MILRYFFMNMSMNGNGTNEKEMKTKFGKK